MPPPIVYRAIAALLKCSLFEASIPATIIINPKLAKIRFIIMSLKVANIVL